MKKRSVLRLLLVSMLLVSNLSACHGNTAPGPDAPTTEPPSSAGDNPETRPPEITPEAVELTLQSWRADDMDEINILLAEYKKAAPYVTITFIPLMPQDYGTLHLQLEGGVGPDLLYARSYATGQELFDEGYTADCTDIPGLMENFTEANLAPWRTPDGKMFAVPFAAVSHGVYYNKDVFAANNLSVPATWEEFIGVCKTLKEAGVVPLANGLADEWDILECFFLGMLPNYTGVGDARVAYETGEKPLNDENFVNAFTDLAQVSPYLPEGFEAVTYGESQALFSAGTAAMFVDGSWTISVYDDVAFDWGVFAIPARVAADTKIVFHPDMAITMNTATSHPEECRAFLAWLCRRDGAAAAAKALPVGFFPMINIPITMDDPHANEFFALNQGRQTDARFVWPALMDLYAPMDEVVINVLKGTTTPREAADFIEAERTQIVEDDYDE